MNNENLTAPPIQSTEEAVRKGRAGGIQSGIVRRRRKELRERLQMLEDEIIKNTSTGEEKERADVIALQLMKKAVGGDLKAIRLYAELTGQLVQRVEVAPPKIEVVDIGIAEDAEE